ncbi:MFS transporter [candidate division KSB1 bacterium]|nr:MFS transporter [candidate division KSB1 bacterium]
MANSIVLDKPVHSHAFRFRRFLNWFPMGLTYAFLYMGRYNLTVSKNALGDLMTKTDFGLIFGAGTITYAFAFLINGPLTDRIGGKKAILIGAIGSALMNILLGIFTYMVVAKQAAINIALIFSIIYSFNMYCQSFGAVAIVKVNSSWFHVRERGIFGGIFGILISMGIYFAFDWGVAIVEATRAVVATELGFIQVGLRNLLNIDTAGVDQTWWVFFIPAILLGAFAIIELFLLKDKPSEAGFEDFDTADASSGEEDEPFNLGILLKKILTNKIIITIALIEFCTGVLRNGIMHWYLIFTNEINLSPDHFMRAHWGLILMLAGSFGGIFAGFVSDKIFGSRRGPVAALFYGLMVVLTFAMGFVLDMNPFILGAIVSFMSLCVIGTHGMLSGTATMDFGGRKGAATAVGLIDGFVYLGTGLQSISLGFLLSKSWGYWSPFLLPFAILGFILAVRIWYAFPQAKRKGK